MISLSSQLSRHRKIPRNTPIREKNSWANQFDCSHLRPLIICRGPVRKEAMEVFSAMGITEYGILLSEKDSMIYSRALAPELKLIRDPKHIHRVTDYSGANQAERQQRIEEIIQLAKTHHYNAIFAGYGFMAEEEALVSAIEAAGLFFIGPSAHVVRSAGRKDQAKIIARSSDVSVTPGIELVLPQSASVDEVCQQAVVQAKKLLTEFPGRRIRLKHTGGGGGKGQRILTAPEQAPGLVREILNEMKCLGPDDNKNIVMELNCETTRHQEIQLIGNGDWCVSLGARDCSAQRHEQKLLEVSQTQEDLVSALVGAEQLGLKEQAAALLQEQLILTRMEEEAMRFGQAVELNSVSTFECIVDGDRHYFMEMNTRIQVEHRVSEGVYALLFTNPQFSDVDSDAGDSFVVESLIEMMLLLACHADRLPKPQRIPRFKSCVEARINATNDALQPHAGGVITDWSDPIEGELRDDQGISAKNPDTDLFMKYTLAGAYDSNMALLVAHGEDRSKAYGQLAEILRCTRMDGDDLKTNADFHYGLIHWLLAHHTRSKLTTQFVGAYLTQVALLKRETDQVDLAYLFNGLIKQHQQSEWIKVIEEKQTLTLRPLEKLLSAPHVLSGWLSMAKSYVEWHGDKIIWQKNPIALLRDTYYFLNMEYSIDMPAAYSIWWHDEALLQKAESFYALLEEKTGISAFELLEKSLMQQQPTGDFSQDLWQQAQAAHQGFQAGLDLLKVLFIAAHRCDFYQLATQKNLEVTIPPRLLDPALQKEVQALLAPPPPASDHEIVAVSGGMFYAQETPESPPFVKPGDHFNVGDPLYIIEVMKMFNKVTATFSGRINECVIENTQGEIVKQGQVLFSVIPDHPVDLDSLRQQRENKKLFNQALFRELI